MATTPVVPPAPALFSITNCWPRRAERRSAKMRASTSVLPPAANGTNTETDLVGHASWAKLAAPLAATTAKATAKLHFISHLLPGDFVASFDCQSASLDGASPFLDFPLDEFLQIFRRAPVGRHEFGTDLLQFSSHARRLHDTDSGVVQPFDDRSRRTLGQEEAIPEEGFEAGQALLLRGRKVRQNGRS